MKSFACAIGFCLIFALSCPVFADEFSLDSIKSIMRKVAKYSFTTWGGGTAAGLDRDWSRGTIMTGIMGLYRTTKEQQWLDSIDNGARAGPGLGAAAAGTTSAPFRRSANATLTIPYPGMFQNISLPRPRLTEYLIIRSIICTAGRMLYIWDCLIFQ